MVKDLIKKDLKKLKLNIILDEEMDKILDDAIKVTEEFFGKTLKQLPPTGEAYDFLIDTCKILQEDEKKKIKVKKLVDDYCKSNMSFKEFMENLISGGIGINRNQLYDTTRVLQNNGIDNQQYSNTDNDDVDVNYDDVWNTSVKGNEKILKDIINGDVGEKGITSDEYFNKTKKSPDTQDSVELPYEVTQYVKFHQQDSDEEQEGEIISITDDIAKIKVQKGNQAGKVLDINIKNIKGKIKKNISDMKDDNV